MKNYDAYIFDFDYTLADATEPVVQSFLYALEKMNLQEILFVLNLIMEHALIYKK